MAHVQRQQSGQISECRIVHVLQSAVLHVELLQLGQIQERDLCMQLDRIVGQPQHDQVGYICESIRLDGANVVRADIQQLQTIGTGNVGRRYARQLIVVEAQVPQLTGRGKGTRRNVSDAIVTQIDLENVLADEGNCGSAEMRAIDVLIGVVVVAMAVLRAGLFGRRDAAERISRE